MIDISKSTTPNIYQYNGGGAHTSDNNIAVKDSKDLSLSDKQNDINMEELTNNLNQVSSEMDADIEFAYNDKINEIYINVIDKNTGEVIRQLPSEEAMKIKETMKELVGTLFDMKG